MRLTTLTSLSLALSIASLNACAYEGKVVAKEFRPFPFIESVGMDGIYKFQLRSRSGVVYDQLVTPNVFAAYEVGDYFNDCGTPPARTGKDKDFKSMPYQAPWQEPPVPMGPEPLRTRQPTDKPYQPVKTTSVHRHHAKATAHLAAAKHHHHASKGTRLAAKKKHASSHASHVAQHHTKRHRATA